VYQEPCCLASWCYCCGLPLRSPTSGSQTSKSYRLDASVLRDGSVHAGLEERNVKSVHSSRSGHSGGNGDGG
jgi:hypothetical protein